MLWRINYWFLCLQLVNESHSQVSGWARVDLSNGEATFVPVSSSHLTMLDNSKTLNILNQTLKRQGSLEEGMSNSPCSTPIGQLDVPD